MSSQSDSYLAGFPIYSRLRYQVHLAVAHSVEKAELNLATDSISEQLLTEPAHRCVWERRVGPKMTLILPSLQVLSRLAE